MLINCGTKRCENQLLDGDNKNELCDGRNVNVEIPFAVGE